MKTPEEARKAWVEALRSGEYKQGKGYLHAEGKFCCLGVACHLAVEDGVPVAVRDDDPVLVTYDGRGDVLPASVQRWLGLSTETGDYEARNRRDSDLTKRNDHGATFKRIADIIESEPKGLFA